MSYPQYDMTYQGCGPVSNSASASSHFTVPTPGEAVPFLPRFSDAPYTFFEEDVHDVFDEASELLISKHNDYGPRNISDSPGGPLNGLRVRMHDKLARINNLVDSGAEPENESLQDSFIDCLNYAAIGLLVLRDKWPTG